MASTATIDGLEFTRYVQSSFRIKSPALTLYIDPHRMTEKETGGEKGDLILITHPHPDHLDLNALNVVRRDDSIIVCSPAVARELEGKVPRVIALKEGRAIRERGLSIKAVPGYNQFHPREQEFNVGFVFLWEGRVLYHAGDTSRIPEFVGLGPVDIAMFPIGGHYTCDEEEAAKTIVEDINPRVVIPMHYQYATGGDPEKFKSLVSGVAQVEILEPILKVRMG